MPVDDSAVERVVNLQELISQARALKAQYNLANKRDVEVFFGAEGDAAKVISDNAGLVKPSPVLVNSKRSAISLQTACQP